MTNEIATTTKCEDIFPEYYYNEKTGTIERVDTLILFTGCDFEGDYITTKRSLEELRIYDMHRVRSIYMHKGFM